MGKKEQSRKKKGEYFLVLAGAPHLCEVRGGYCFITLLMFPSLTRRADYVRSEEPPHSTGRANPRVLGVLQSCISTSGSFFSLAIFSKSEENSTQIPVG